MHAIWTQDQWVWSCRYVLYNGDKLFQLNFFIQPILYHFLNDQNWKFQKKGLNLSIDKNFITNWYSNLPHCVQVGRLRGLCLGRLEIDLKFIALYMHWNRSRLTTPTYFVVVGNKSKMNRIFSYSDIVLNPNWYRNFTSALHNR